MSEWNNDPTQFILAYNSMLATMMMSQKGMQGISNPGSIFPRSSQQLQHDSRSVVQGLKRTGASLDLRTSPVKHPLMMDDMSAQMNAYKVLLNTPDNPNILKGVMSAGIPNALMVLETEPRSLSTAQEQTAVVVRPPDSPTPPARCDASYYECDAIQHNKLLPIWKQKSIESKYRSEIIRAKTTWKQRHRINVSISPESVISQAAGTIHKRGSVASMGGREAPLIGIKTENQNNQCEDEPVDMCIKKDYRKQFH